MSLTSQLFKCIDSCTGWRTLARSGWSRCRHQSDQLHGLDPAGDWTKHLTMKLYIFVFQTLDLKKYNKRKAYLTYHIYYNMFCKITCKLDGKVPNQHSLLLVSALWSISFLFCLG